jgi:putative flippase GtrA
MRSYLGVLLGPGIDIAVYCLAVGLSASPECAQILSFGAAMVFAYLPGLRLHPDVRAHGWSVRLALHLVAVTLMAFFVRSGALITLMGGSESPGWAAIMIAAIATALIVRLGFAYCASYREWRLGGGAGWRSLAIGMVVLAAARRPITGTTPDIWISGIWIIRLWWPG